MAGKSIPPNISQELREAGNRAAHEGDIIRDASLFSTGHISKEFGWLFRKAYLTEIRRFAGSFDKLKPLQDYPKQVMMRNLNATLHKYLTRDIQYKEKDPDFQRFRDLIADWRTLEESIANATAEDSLDKLYQTQEERDAAFEQHPDVDAILKEMREIVAGVQEAAKELCNRGQQ